LLSFSRRTFFKPKSKAAQTCKSHILATVKLSLMRVRVAIKIPPEQAYLFNDERNTYSWRPIKTSPHIRSLYEYIDDEANRCLVFEWMDRTLWDAKDESIAQKKYAFKTVATSCLKGLLAFQKMDGENDYCHAGESKNLSIWA
jgi:hypothetical protein